MLLQLIVLLLSVHHDQGHDTLHVVTKPVPSLPADGAQGLDVGPGGGQIVRLAQLLHDHADQLDVQCLVTAQHQVAQTYYSSLSHCQPINRSMYLLTLLTQTRFLLLFYLGLFN